MMTRKLALCSRNVLCLCWRRLAVAWRYQVLECLSASCWLTWRYTNELAKQSARYRVFVAASAWSAVRPLKNCQLVRHSADSHRRQTNSFTTYAVVVSVLSYLRLAWLQVNCRAAEVLLSTGMTLTCLPYALSDHDVHWPSLIVVITTSTVNEI